MSTKICKDCNEEKALTEFSRNGKYYHSFCKTCISIRSKGYYYNHQEERQSIQRRYVKEHTEERTVYAAEHYQANADKIKAKVRQWHDDNREHINESLRVRRKTDIEYKLRCNLRNRMRTVLKGSSNNITRLSVKLLGCTVEQFKVYIEGLFKPGMNWSNHSLLGWHIDHIKPLSKIDLTDPIEQSIVFHYSNLQPLWAKENWSKAAHVVRFL